MLVRVVNDGERFVYLFDVEFEVLSDRAFLSADEVGENAQK